MQKFSIEAVNLTKRYGAFTALSDLNLRLEGTKCVGFLGPNGAGKTTTLKIFTDMIHASSGEARINGVDSHRNKKAALASCGTLIETPEIYPSLTPMEALSMVAEIKGVPAPERATDIRHAVETVKMNEWIDRKIGKFSKGMKQRINIAAALIGNPSILLLDEPTSGLDPRGMSEVRDIIKNLKRENRLIFMSSHILSEVSEVCDEVAMINHGILLTYGKLRDVIARFSGKSGSIIEVETLREASGVLLRRVARLGGVESVDRLASRKFNIKFSGSIIEQGKLLERLVRLRIGMVSFKQSSSALEDAYLNLFKETV
jgi:ABC-2 type transport system ATP-binding protein